jgi:hypothetical protein
MFLPGFARKSTFFYQTCRCSNILLPGVFIILNVIRALSIIALLLVFASSIVVLVDDVEAVNAFVNGSANTTSFESGNSDYIPYDLLLLRKTVIDFDLGTARFPTSPREPFGLS